MKNKIVLITLITSIIMVASCKKEDNSPSTTTSNSSVAGIITTGSWHVSYFHENSNDHTSNFSGYTFTFSSNGSMAAVDSSGTASGTWRIDDSNMNEFHMSIGNTTPLTDLNKGWLITSQTSTEIQMKDDGSSPSEFLYFTKN